MPHRPNATHGFVVVTDSVRIWFAGDTAPFAAMADIPALAGGPIDLALVPVGGWGPRLSGGHMDAVQAARACAVVGARVAVPVHWGTLHAPVSRRLPPGWMDRAGPAFAAAAARVAPAVQVRVVIPGEQIEVPERAGHAGHAGGVSRASNICSARVGPAGERPSLPQPPPASAGSPGWGWSGRDVGGRT